MRAEKYVLSSELQKMNESLTGKKRLAMSGQGDFPGGVNVARAAMNVKHRKQHLALDDPEFPYLFDGKENIAGEFSSHYKISKKPYRVVSVCRKYDKMLHGKSRYGLYFLYCPDDDSYTVINRKEVESLTESFGFEYNNELLDSLEEGELIPTGTRLYSSRSYDEYMNIGTGVHARTLFATDPHVQDDAIVVSESFAKKMVANDVTTKIVPISENTVLLDLYGSNGHYKGFPDIGETIEKGIICATRQVKESQMLSEMRDGALRFPNPQDRIYYGKGEVTDITVYCNKATIEKFKVTEQLLGYYQDSLWYWRSVYQTCKKIVNSGAKKIDPEIHRWMRQAINYLDGDAQWALNDTVFDNIVLSIEVREKLQVDIGRKITGRFGNKTVVSKVVPDDQMPYLVEKVTVDQYGRKHPVGIRERVDAITNPLAVANRTIGLAPQECSLTFILDKARKHAATLPTHEERAEFIFDIIHLLNEREYEEIKSIYDGMTEKEQKKFIDECISLNADGTISTTNGIYIRWEPFSTDQSIRDSCIAIYKKYPDVFKPYHVFNPKPNWGRDVYIGEHPIGYQYMMMLKQSARKGFIVRSGGAISDEGLPEKTNSKKIGTSWASSKPIRYGEYETPGFLVITQPEDFAMFTALYRSSLDGRKYLCEAVLQDDGLYNLPDYFVSRTVQILQVYLKQLGVGMDCVNEDDEIIIFPEDLETQVEYELQDYTIMCSIAERDQLKKINRVYRRYLKENNWGIVDVDDAWEYIMKHLPFKKKELLPDVPDLFMKHIQYFAREKE